MARWHLTSSAGLHSQASNICEVAELNASGFQSEQNYFIRSYEKRAISNVNFIEFEDNNWVWADLTKHRLVDQVDDAGAGDRSEGQSTKTHICCRA